MFYLKKEKLQAEIFSRGLHLTKKQTTKLISLNKFFENLHLKVNKSFKAIATLKKHPADLFCETEYRCVSENIKTVRKRCHLFFFGYRLFEPSGCT